MSKKAEEIEQEQGKGSIRYWETWKVDVKEEN